LTAAPAQDVDIRNTIVQKLLAKIKGVVFFADHTMQRRLGD
jgi:hypothetical protein